MILRHLGRAVGGLLNAWLFSGQRPAKGTTARTTSSNQDDAEKESASSDSASEAFELHKPRSRQDRYAIKGLVWLWRHPASFIFFIGTTYKWALAALYSLLAKLHEPVLSANTLWAEQSEAWRAAHGSEAVSILIFALSSREELLHAYTLYVTMTGAKPSHLDTSPRLVLSERLRRKLIRLTSRAQMYDIAEWLCDDLQRKAPVDTDGSRRLEEGTLRTLVMHYARLGASDLVQSTHQTLMRQAPQAEDAFGLLPAAEALCASRRGDLPGVMRAYGLHLEDGQPFGSVLPDDAKLSLPRAAPLRLMEALTYGDHVPEAEALYDRVLEVYGRVTPQIFDLLMDSYTRQGDLGSALSLYDELKASSMPLSIRTYTSLVTGFARRKDPESAYRAVQAAIADGLKPDQIMWNALLNAYVECGQWEAMTALAEWMRNHPSLAMRPSADTHNILLKGQMMSGSSPGRVRELFDDIRKSHRPNEHTWAYLLQTYCDRGLLKEAFQIFQQLDDALRKPYVSAHKGGGATGWHFTILMHAYIRHKRFNEGRQVFEEMQRRGIQPNNVTWGVVISGYARMRHGEGLSIAKEIADRAAIESSQPPHLHDTTWSTPALRQRIHSQALYLPILLAATRSGNPKEAQDAVQSIAALGIRVSSHTWITLLDVHRKSRDLDAVARVWDSIFRDAIKQRDGKYTLEDGVAAQAEHEATGVHPPLKLPDVRSYTRNLLCVPLSMAIDACSAAGRHDDVGRLWAQVRDNGFAFDPQNWNDLVVALLRAGRLEDALRIVNDLLLEADHQPPPGVLKGGHEASGTPDDDESSRLGDESSIGHADAEVSATEGEASAAQVHDSSNPSSGVKEPIIINGEIVFSDADLIKQREPTYPIYPRQRRVMSFQVREPVRQVRRPPRPISRASFTPVEEKAKSRQVRPFYPTLLQHDFGAESAPDLAAATRPFFPVESELDPLSNELVHELAWTLDRSRDEASGAALRAASIYPLDDEVGRWQTQAGHQADVSASVYAADDTEGDVPTESGADINEQMSFAIKDADFEEPNSALVEALVRRADAGDFTSRRFTAAPPSPSTRAHKGSRSPKVSKETKRSRSFKASRGLVDRKSESQITEDIEAGPDKHRQDHPEQGSRSPKVSKQTKRSRSFKTSRGLVDRKSESQITEDIEEGPDKHRKDSHPEQGSRSPKVLKESKRSQSFKASRGLVDRKSESQITEDMEEGPDNHRQGSHPKQDVETGDFEEEDAPEDILSDPPPYMEYLDRVAHGHVNDFQANSAQKSLLSGPRARSFWFANSETLVSILATMRKLRDKRFNPREPYAVPGAVRVDRALRMYPRAAGRLYSYSRSLVYREDERKLRAQRGWLEDERGPNVPKELNTLLGSLPERPDQDSNDSLSDLDRIRQDPSFWTFAKKPSGSPTRRDLPKPSRFYPAPDTLGKDEETTTQDKGLADASSDHTRSHSTPSAQGPSDKYGARDRRATRGTSGSSKTPLPAARPPGPPVPPHLLRRQ
ncbi:FOG: PPR repeat [Ceraceosorus bombacis]|uniref:FOG: PPR repeat n=1 Tax=Ceraceosorus bombacis TaxID=401625 RepID=A0A0P1BDV8_9BASI|nr:FOG: PPR repeat [Ceraceosorus bombacis]